MTDYAQNELAKVIVTATILLAFVWVWSQLIRSEWPRKVFVRASLLTIAGMYAWIAWENWL